MNSGLSHGQTETLRRILARHADSIERVDIFGSRAQGTHRPNSDLDLVIHGSLTESQIDRIWTLFQESNQPFSVDVKSYPLTRYAPLESAHGQRAQNPVHPRRTDAGQERDGKES